jgi:hypothetical protein
MKCVCQKSANPVEAHFKVDLRESVQMHVGEADGLLGGRIQCKFGEGK